ncbi:MAG: DUF1302 family protein [Methyloprofundus sp.]|nr:DUF1302 family protein [Methyloprofundus sp.]
MRIISCHSLLLLSLYSATLPVMAMDFRLGEVEGLLDIELAYGNMSRVQKRDQSHIATTNGGTGTGINSDDGNLNYDRGVVSNMFRATGGLTLRWRNFGAVVRGYALYDYESQSASRERTPLSDGAKSLIGLDAGLLEYYLSAHVDLKGIPMQFRVGDQIINWGETRFIRDGIDVLNPVNALIPLQPAATARDLRTPQGMLWGAASVTEQIAIEAYYQYDWKGMQLPPVGSYFSNNDLFGAEGLNYAVLGGGLISDLGTDLDTQFGLPDGTLGFDDHYMKVFGSHIDRPQDGGQYGFMLQGYLPMANATKIALHFMNYHSRLPMISGTTANQQAIDTASPANIKAEADLLAPIYESTGLSPEEAAQQSLGTAAQLAASNYANEAAFFLEYPEDIRMLGFSFNTATLSTGTLLAGDISHHFNAPFQLNPDKLLGTLFAPISPNNPNELGADSTVQGYIRLHKTQISASLTQLFGPQLGASQSMLILDVASVHVHNMPDKDTQPLLGVDSRLPSKNSWGYRLVAKLNYNSVFGGLNLSPSVIWTHDVDGITPGPAGAFVQGRKSATLALSGVFLNSWTAGLSYTNFFGAREINLLNDRDFIRFRIAYAF